MTDHKKEKDALSGVETTGHEWDGIKELNNPAPRWWLWVLYVTIIWSVGYWVLYPAWPTISGEGFRGGTVGRDGTNQYTDLKASQIDIQNRRDVYLSRFRDASYDDILNDPELYEFALAGGKAAFKDNCATCHGTGGAGAPGYPNLNDDDWLWGGAPADIEHTIRVGIRGLHEDTRSSMMPGFGQILPNADQHKVAAYVSHLAAGEQTSQEGAALFSQYCAVCHGEDARGTRELGAPNLSDAIWLKSEDGTQQAILAQMRHPKHGVMPTWEGRLDEDTIRLLTVYVHSLGGGE